MEKLHLKFCKRLLSVHSKSTNLTIYSEMGRTPLIIPSIKITGVFEIHAGTSIIQNILK